MNDQILRSKYDKLLAASENSENKACLRKIWSRAKIDDVIKTMKNSKLARAAGTKLTSMEYYWTSKYDLVTVNGKEHLTFKKKKPEGPTVLIIPREEYYDILKPVHLECGHGGRDKMQKSIKDKFYVPKKAIEIFNSVCPVCIVKKSNAIEQKSKALLPSESFNVRGLLDILDFQFCPDGEYKWLLQYQDQGTKFFNFRPLVTNEPKEIARELFKIFLTFGAPTILQSSTGKEPIADILKEIKKIWAHCKTINGSGRFEQYDPDKPLLSNSDIVTKMRSWMKDNNAPRWSIGCYFYQYHINTSSTAYRNTFCRGHKQELNFTPTFATLSDEDSASEKTNQNQDTGTEIVKPIEEENKTSFLGDNYIFLQEFNTGTTSNTEMNKLPEHMELKTEIKIEFDDSEFPLEQDDSSSEDIDTNSNNDSHQLIDICIDNVAVPIERQDSEIMLHSNEGNVTNTNKTCEIELLKKEDIEENENLQLSCPVCHNAAFIEHTAVCFACNCSIHRKCAINVTGEGSNMLCYECLGKRFPEFKEKVLPKCKKRRAQDDVDRNTAKRVPPSAVDTNAPGPSSFNGE